MVIIIIIIITTTTAIIIIIIKIMCLLVKLCMSQKYTTHIKALSQCAIIGRFKTKVNGK